MSEDRSVWTSDEILKLLKAAAEKATGPFPLSFDVTNMTDENGIPVQGSISLRREDGGESFAYYELRTVKRTFYGLDATERIIATYEVRV